MTGSNAQETAEFPTASTGLTTRTSIEPDAGDTSGYTAGDTFLRR